MKSSRRYTALAATVLGLAASVLLSPQAMAAGFLIADPAFHPVMPNVPRTGVRPPVLVPIPPILDPRRPQPRPQPHQPTLHGSVSHGLHMQAQEIKVDISDQVAKIYITQTFVNDTDQNLAGTYLFPLPEDTTFSSFSLHIDGKPVEGKILAAAEARAQYEAIVRQMVDPGLLEYADYKTVRARIFPIPAHGTKKVELEYTQLLKAEGGMLKYRFPLKSDNEAAGPVDDTKITVRVNGKQGLRSIWSPSHTVTVDRLENSRAKVTFAARDTVQDKDFLLYYSVSDKDMAASVVTHKLDGEDGYFLLTLSPPLKATQAVPKDIVLVADTSGSMQGEKIEQCKKALKHVVNSLAPGDRFGVVNFGTDAESFKSALAAATPENKKAAATFIDDLEARGGTNIGDALRTGLSLLKHDAARPAYLIMMTDGEPTVGETSVANLLKLASDSGAKKDVRIFDFGVGYDVNTRLLNQLSESHHGTSQYLEPGENLEVAMTSFYDKIKSPVLSQVAIAYNNLTVKDVYPRQPKDMFAGSQVLLLGRYKSGAAATVQVTGTVNGAPRSFSFPLKFEASEPTHSFLPKLWAMRRIAYLTDVAQSNGDTKEVVDEIVALSKKHGIISAYTSFLATDPKENQRLPGQSIAALPSNMPAAAPREEAWRGAPGQMRSQMRGRIQDRADSTNFRFASNAGINGAGGAGSSNHAGVFKGRGQYQLAEPSVTSSFASADEMRDSFKAKLEGAPSTGKQAVAREKKIAAMKNAVAFDSKDDVNAAFRSTIKTVEGKTFYLKDGFWTDSSYKNEKCEEVKFGSDKYFALSRTVAGLSRYFAVGKQVIVLLAGHAYKVVN